MARLTIIALVLLTAAVTAPAASAHFPQTATGTVPAGGSLGVTSSPLPPNATSATITTQPSDPSDPLVTVLEPGATRGQRVVYCVLWYASTLKNTSWGPGGTVPNGVRVLAYFFLQACLEVALSGQPAGQARAAAAGCPQQQVLRVPIKVRRTNGRYAGTTGAPVLRKRGTGAVRMTCRRKGRGIQIRLRSSKRGKPLRSTVGTNLALGFLNPSRTRSVTVKTTFAVR